MEAGSEKRAWKLVLSYDGTDFHGWQIQPILRTIQGELGTAIARVTGEQVLPQGSGRTDAGVHALAQVASFSLAAPIPETNFIRALNRTLPASIRVIHAQRMPGGFHARHSARGKTYEYRIFRGEVCPPWLGRYVYALNHPLDRAAMRHAALRVLGVHDFTSFAANDSESARRDDESSQYHVGEMMSEPRSNVRTIDASDWIYGPAELAIEGAAGFSSFPHEDNFLIYRVHGNGFLHHMVRNLVGTFLEVGRGNLSVEAIPEILAARARARAGPTAPARGLFLTNVDY